MQPQSRWINKETNEYDHKHGQENYNHIIPSSEFSRFLYQNHDQQSKQLLEILEKHVQKLTEIVKSSQSLINALQSQQTIVHKINKDKIQWLLKQDQSCIIQLNKEQIDKFLNFSIQFEESKTLGYLQNIGKECSGLISFVKALNLENTPNQTQQIQQMDRLVKIFQQADYQSYKSQNEIQEDFILSTQISKNEQYLALAEYNKIIIINLNNKSKVGKLLVKNVMSMKLILDSKFLVIGSYYGKFYLATLNKLKLVYQKQILENCIRFIKLLNNNQLLTCSFDKSIIITDLFQKKELFIIKKASSFYINYLDYDQTNQTIVSCFSDKSIQFLKTNGQVLINQKNAHKDEINQIESINKVHLLSISKYEMKIWKIDYNKKDLTQIRQLCDYNYICCSQSIMNNSMIIKINLRQIYFLDLNLNLIESIEHGKSLKMNYSSDQLDTLNQIMFSGTDWVNVIKKDNHI